MDQTVNHFPLLSHKINSMTTYSKIHELFVSFILYQLQNTIYWQNIFQTLTQCFQNCVFLILLPNGQRVMASEGFCLETWILEGWFGKEECQRDHSRTSASTRNTQERGRTLTVMYTMRNYTIHVVVVFGNHYTSRRSFLF